LIAIGLVDKTRTKILIAHEVVLGAQQCLAEDTREGDGGMMLGESIKRVEPRTKETIGKVGLWGWDKYTMHGAVLDQLRVINQQVPTRSSGRELGKILMEGPDILGIEGNREELSQEELLVDVRKIQWNRVVEDHTVVGTR
jgi:hypothetical protein